MDVQPVIIFGLGFTGARVAKRLAARGIPVVAPARGDSLTAVPRGARLLHTIPPSETAENEVLRERIASIVPARLVYISTTGVYGAQTIVDANTAPAPEEGRARMRLAEEQWIAAGPWSSLILRSAAIYGPGRGVHLAAREGRQPRGAGIVSRIHVDDLAALADAALFASIEGAFPVADENPCASEEIIRYVNPHFEPPATPPLVAGRCVNGSRIREILGVALRHPSWESGVPAAIAEEARAEEGNPEPEQMDLSGSNSALSRYNRS